MIRTLVVDDDFRVANVHGAYVQLVPGFEVVGKAHSAQRARELIEALRPDLVLLDLFLPDANGLDVVAQLRGADGREVDVIVITGSQSAQSVQAAMRLGSVHYLLKPFAFEALRTRLRSYAAVRARFEASSRQMDQRQVDGVFCALRPAQVTKPPRRRAPRTLDAIEAMVARDDQGVTAVQVAGNMGLSRATAQRNLAQLAETGRARIELRYRALGRPEHVYRSVPRTTPTAELADRNRSRRLAAG